MGTQASAAKRLVHSKFERRQAGYIYKMKLSIMALSALMNLCTFIFARSSLPETNLKLKSNVNVAMDKYSNEDILTREAREAEPEAEPLVGGLWNAIQWLSTPLTADQEQALLDLAAGAPITEDLQRTLCRGIEEQCAVSQRTRFSLGRNGGQTRSGRINYRIF